MPSVSTNQQSVILPSMLCICNRMRPSRITDKFSRVFSKFSQNCPSRVATRAICENFENTSENLSLILRGLNAITCLLHRGQNFLKTFHCTSKHNPPPALRINNSPHIKLLLSVQNKKRNCLLCICSSFD